MAKMAHKSFILNHNKESTNMAYNFPPVNKIFDDLDKFRDFCRMGGWGDTWGFPFDEKDLYNSESPVWQAYQKHLIYKSRNRNRPHNNHNGGKRFYDRRGNQ